MTPMQKLRVRARSGVAESTLRHYLDDPMSVRDATRMRIENAARDEGVTLSHAAHPCDSNPPPASAA